VLPRPLRLALIAVLALLASAEPALAFKIGGSRWSGRPARITYFEATPKGYHASIALGAKAWNTSGIPVRFVRVASRRKARIVITQDAGIAPAAGFASIGFQSHNYIKLTGCQHGCDRFSMAALVAHEMGHVLGLDHEQRKCSVMNGAQLYGTCKPRRPKAPWLWRCRILQKDDLAGARALYGGRPRLGKHEFCEKQPKPPAVVGLTATALRASPASPAKLTWKNPSKLITGVVILRKVGSCPRNLNDGESFEAATNLLSATDVADTPLAAGPICYRLWTTDEFGRIGPSKTVTLAYPGAPPVPPATSIALTEVANAATGVEVTASVTVPNVNWLSAVELRRDLGACPTSTTGTPVDRVAINGTRATIDDSSNTVEGTWCYAAFTVDLWGRTAASGASQTINHVPPRAPSPTGATGLVDGSGGHISWNWPGDGLTMVALYRSAGACAGPIVVDPNDYLGDVSFVDVATPGTFDDAPAAGSYCYALVGSDAAGFQSPPVGVTLTYP
jgi:hypothetical protein